MAHRLAIPARSLRNAIWLLIEVSGDPVVKRQEIGLARVDPSVPDSPGSSVTRYVVFGASDADGRKRRMREPGSRMPAAPGAATTASVPGTSGWMTRSSDWTVPGSSGRSKTRAIGVVGEIPSTSFAGNRTRAERPDRTAWKLSVYDPSSGVPALSRAAAASLRV